MQLADRVTAFVLTTLLLAVPVIAIGVTPPISQQERPAGDPGEEAPPKGPPEQTRGEPHVVVRGSARLGWYQQGDGPEVVAGYAYQLWVDGEPQALADVECGSPPSPNGFECEAPLPALSPGDHVLAVVAQDRQHHATGFPSASLRVRVQPETLSSPAPPVRIREDRGAVLASGFDDLTDLAVLPDGRVLMTERAGRVRVHRPDGSTAIALNALSDVVTGEGRGVLSIAIGADFETTKSVYVAHSVADGARVVRLQMVADSLAAPAVVLAAVPGGSYRAVVRIGPEGKLYLAVDAEPSRGAPTAPGRVLRFNQDGTSPTDRAVAGWPVSIDGLNNGRGMAWTGVPAALWALDVSPAPTTSRLVAPHGVSAKQTVWTVALPDGAVPTSVTGLSDGTLLVTTDAPEQPLFSLRPGADGHVDIRSIPAPAHALRAVAVAASGAIYACSDLALIRLAVPDRQDE